MSRTKNDGRSCEVSGFIVTIRELGMLFEYDLIKKGDALRGLSPFLWTVKSFLQFLHETNDKLIIV